jgi:hypothetical protein
VLAGASLRLLGHELRQAARRRRDAVALRRPASRRRRVPLHRSPVQHRRRRLRDLRVRPAHRGRARRDRVPRGQPGRAGHPCTRRSTSRRTSCVGGLSAAVHHRPDGPPLPHPDQDRPRPQLDRAAPDVWVELSPADAARFGIAEGDLVRVESRRGRIQARARRTGITEGTVFAPFHYGYFDADGAGPDGRPRAANELTITEWDPVSKQPHYKICAVRVTKLAGAEEA